MPDGGRTYAQILRANLLTFFTVVLFAIGIALLALGRTGDAVVSAGLGLLNALISAAQEMRAKHRLDALRRRSADPGVQPRPPATTGPVGTGPARRSARTPLQHQIDVVIRAVVLAVALMSTAILGQAALEGLPAVRMAQISAVLSGLIPYGLFLLVTLAYAVGAAGIARRGALVQRVNAVESLSNVDVLCARLGGGLADDDGRLRPGAAQALADLRERGIEVRLLDERDAEHVRAAAHELGLPAADVLVAGELEGLGAEDLDRIVRGHAHLAGADARLAEQVVDSLVRAGRYVAMVGGGDGDVPALTLAHVGVAVQSGGTGARDAADIVLLEDSFAALPVAHHEGQRIIGGVSPAMKLFLTRVATSAGVILGVAVLGLGFPYEPAQGSLTIFTVGIPTLFLTAWARPQRCDPHLLGDLARFVVPAAVVTGGFAIAIYAALHTLLSRALGEGGVLPPQAIADFEEFTGVASADPRFVELAATAVAQTSLSMFTSVTGLLLVLFLEPPARFFRGWAPVSPDRRPAVLVLVLFATFVVVLQTPALARYFGLHTPGGFEAPVVTAATVLWFFLLRTVWRHDLLRRALGLHSAPRG
ncbi:P-type E1-E2 ATPase [Kineococcus xinjiangensis]|uniref:P-type E1-E2 ATPase n=1 Tax=Kineococcus xinjiangensis TaxID=512762 RepID=A0A2S6IK05_9ACTN|nr:HAD family hydrolase [Kineococcus xinjiangensis]PPK94563.1 P-type E1-E2 ATPase [Kineococcus xinjiangensis]